MMLLKKKFKFDFIQFVTFMYMSIIYNAITMFAILYTTCVEPSLSTGPHREQQNLSHTHQNTNATVSSVKRPYVEDEMYPERLLTQNDTEDYFDPNTILFSPNNRKTDQFEMAANNNTYISFEKAAAMSRARYPIKPMENNSVVLPIPDFHTKKIPHVLHKKLWPVDLVSRKIFIRGNGTNAKIIPATV